MSHGNLHGPHDFHSLHHYLNLYMIARKLEIEGLQNQSGSILDFGLLHSLLTRDQPWT